MTERIERHAAVEFCRRIAAFPGDKGMGKFMQRQNDYGGEKARDDLYKITHANIIAPLREKSKCVKGFFR